MDPRPTKRRCVAWEGACQASLSGMPTEVTAHIQSYLCVSTPWTPQGDQLPTACRHLHALCGNRWKRGPCKFETLCGRRICTRHTPSTPFLRYFNNQIRNIGYTHFPTLRLARMAQRFVYADAICCGGKGFTVYRWLPDKHSFTTMIKWKT